MDKGIQVGEMLGQTGVWEGACAAQCGPGIWTEQPEARPWGEGYCSSPRVYTGWLGTAEGEAGSGLFGVSVKYPLLALCHTGSARCWVAGGARPSGMGVPRPLDRAGG